MKKTILIGILLSLTIGLRAQSAIAEAWLTMPDSLCPFLTEQQRLQVITFAKAGLKDTIPNQFDGVSYPDSINLAQNYISIQMTPNMQVVYTMQDTTIRVEKTVCAPICSTIIQFYSTHWVLLKQEKRPWSIEQTDEDTIQYF